MTGQEDVAEIEMTKVLVTAASKHGATAEIAQAIAEVLAERCAPALRARPVWLFSSGPVGDPAKPDEDPVDVAELVTLTGARDWPEIRRWATGIVTAA